MPSMKQPVLVRSRLDIPADILDEYTAQAEHAQKSLDEIITTRLTSCASHTSIRPLYLNDTQREEAEQLLGGGIFRSPDDLVRALRNSYTVTVGGANVKLDPQIYTLLKDRAAETGTTLRALVLEICNNALSDYALGGH